jgi:hypothetical protein
MRALGAAAPDSGRAGGLALWAGEGRGYGSALFHAIEVPFVPGFVVAVILTGGLHSGSSTDDRIPLGITTPRISRSG